MMAKNLCSCLASIEFISLFWNLHSIKHKTLEFSNHQPLLESKFLLSLLSSFLKLFQFKQNLIFLFHLGCILSFKIDTLAYLFLFNLLFSVSICHFGNTIQLSFVDFSFSNHIISGCLFDFLGPLKFFPIVLDRFSNFLFTLAHKLLYLCLVLNLSKLTNYTTFLSVSEEFFHAGSKVVTWVSLNKGFKNWVCVRMNSSNALKHSF